MNWATAPEHDQHYVRLKPYASERLGYIIIDRVHPTWRMNMTVTWESPDSSEDSGIAAILEKTEPAEAVNVPAADKTAGLRGREEVHPGDMEGGGCLQQCAALLLDHHQSCAK